MEPTDFQNRQIVMWLQHVITPDMRRALMRTLPAAYNAMVCGEVVTVSITHSGEKL